jgi:hypothetical protein
VWWIMLREPHLTGGIGARIANSIPYILTRDVLGDRLLTFVTSAKQKKKGKNAPFDLTCS